MQRIKSLVVYDGERERSIGLYEGDLSRIPPQQPVDLLVASAFPDNYDPVAGTLIGALHRRGLSLARLAEDRAQDLRRESGFWLSHPLDDSHPDLHIGRIACFEPLVLGQPPQVVGELFRGLFPFLDQGRDAVVAMALPGAGNQRWPPEAIFRPLIEAAHHWLQRGMPISELRIVEIQRERIAALADQLQAFEDELYSVAAEPEPVPEPAPDSMAASEPAAAVDPDTETLPRVEPQAAAASEGPYDVFLSYAEEDKEAAERVTGVLQSEMAGVRVFDYRFSIDIGQAWQHEIDEAIEGCRKIVALLSADYFASPECKEELMVARLRNKRADYEVFFPLYWRDAGKSLAMWLQAITYSDCREGDMDKLGDISRRLAAKLR